MKKKIAAKKSTVKTPSPAFAAVLTYLKSAGKKANFSDAKAFVKKQAKVDLVPIVWGRAMSIGKPRTTKVGAKVAKVVRVKAQQTNGTGTFSSTLEDVKAGIASLGRSVAQLEAHLGR